MKTKKGFTLIELLAVIAILAILVVIAVPSVLKLFNKGKESTFVSQAKTIYKAAKDQYTIDALGGSTLAGTPITYNSSNKLSIDVASTVDYTIVVTQGSDKGVNVTSFIVIEGKKQIIGKDENGNGIIDIEEITNVTDKQ
ncbi:MAG: type II secretion system protein [Bacilli bacterium]